MASKAFIIGSVGLALFLGACRAAKSPDANAGSGPQTKIEPDTKVAERPLLLGLIEHISMYPVPNRREDLAFSLVVSASNAGAATTVRGWNLEVDSPGSRGHTILEPVHVNGVVEMPGSAGKKVDLAKEDLALKTEQEPLAKGASVNGILTFVLSKTSEQELASSRTSFILRFKDSQGNAYQTRKGTIGEKLARPETKSGAKP
jgi:hypothetical protein